MTTTPTPTAAQYVMLSPAVSPIVDTMVCAPTLRIAPDGTVQAAFQPEVTYTNDDPWMTVRSVSHVDALRLVVLGLDDDNVIVMTADEYSSQV